MRLRSAPPILSGKAVGEDGFRCSFVYMYILPILYQQQIRSYTEKNMDQHERCTDRSIFIFPLAIQFHVVRYSRNLHFPSLPTSQYCPLSSNIIVLWILNYACLPSGTILPGILSTVFPIFPPKTTRERVLCTQQFQALHVIDFWYSLLCKATTSEINLLFSNWNTS